MTMRDFIKQNRRKIDGMIQRAMPDLKLNDKDREEWIRNDEGLYYWAKREGVKV